MRSDEKYYDPSTAWIGVSLVRRADIHSLHPDTSDWGNALAEEADMDSDTDSEADDEEPTSLDSAEALSRALPVRSSAASFKTGATKKLRPASDVLNRLRWDPNLDLADYIIGYEDRFLGVRETTLEKWKTENTDDEFIPQHRILYFRRRSDGLVVWERRTRIDRIFGSGGGGET